MFLHIGEESEQNSINDFWTVLRSVNLDKTRLESVVSLDTKIRKSLNKSSIKLTELDSLLKSAGKANTFDNVNSDDPAILMLTSGTTGLPKGKLWMKNYFLKKKKNNSELFRIL